MLGLSRNTVNQAYEALVSEGWLVSHVGRGTFVARAGTALAAVRGPSDAGPADPTAAGPRGFAWAGLLARRTRELRLPAAFADPGMPERADYDFRAGQVDPPSLPRSELRRVFGRVFDASLDRVARQNDPWGWRPLRHEVARSLVARGIACEADDVAIVNGAQQAIDLVARVLIDPGDTVALEQPGYFGAWLAFRNAGAHAVGVPVDREGLQTDALGRLLRARRVKLVYTTPAVQSPTGVALAPARRRALLALADEYQLPILEDDYDSELRYGGPPRPALKTLDPAGQVIYVGTFSKALFASLRVGYVVAARPLLRRLVLSRWVADFQTDLVTQVALAELLASGGLERHVRRVRKLYTARGHALVAALRAHMPAGTEWIEPAGGNTVWVTLAPGVDPLALQAAARAEGIEYTRGDVFAGEGGGPPCISLSFAQLEPAVIDEGIARLAACMQRCRTHAA